MPLTDAKVRNAKPKAKPWKLFDRDGLYLLISTNGTKAWRYDYRLHGKRKTISLGIYDDVLLATAREKLREARRLVAAGTDPSVTRRAERRRQVTIHANTFAAVAREWLDKQKAKLAPATIAKIEWLFDGYLFPRIGRRPIAEIEPPDLLDALEQIEARGRHETAHRTKQIAGQVFRYAIATRRATRDPTADLRGAQAPVVTRHHAAVTQPAAIGALLRAIEDFHGSFPVWQALRLAPLVFVRPGELRQAEWSELDLDEGLWRIPATKMKMRRDHLVPLSTQAIQILTELHPLTGRSRYVFPSIRTDARPMSDNTLNAALRRLGYDNDEMTTHGFRAMASTRLNEMGWPADVIERQLAHREQNQSRAVYNRAEYLEERRRMMQAWADELDRLRQLPATGRMAS